MGPNTGSGGGCSGRRGGKAQEKVSKAVRILCFSLGLAGMCSVVTKMRYKLNTTVTLGDGKVEALANLAKVLRTVSEAKSTARLVRPHDRFRSG